MDTNKIPWLMLPLFLLCFSLESHVSFGADTISFNQSLSGDGTIVSASEVFELGFFRPGNSSNYYIGMWYKQASQPNTVWVANREKPVRDINSSVLKIVDGNLVLFDESELPIWSTNISSTNSTSVEAVLLDDGNLVLRQGPNSSTILWQSFDHPADTWLPGMKLSFDKRTNQSRSITSWKSQDDPAPGLFSIQIDPSQTDQIIFLWNRSQRYWFSGTWDEQTKSFTLLPELRTLYLYNISYRHVSNENESYFTYSFDNSFAISRSSIDASGQFKAMLMLTNSGEWSLFFSQPRQQCDVYGYCGAFSNCNEKSRQFCNCLTEFQPASQKEWDQQLYTGGCVRQAKLKCGNDSVNGREDQFLESRMTTFPTNPRTVTADSIKECKSTCLNNCSCTAYAYDESIGCSIWTGDLLNMKQVGEDDAKGKSTLHIRIAEFSNPKNKKGPIIVAVAVSVSAGVALLGVMMFIIIRRQRKTISSTKAAQSSVMAYGYKDLQKATKNFSERLGRGGFGSVFKGTLPDGSLIAVKKLEGINQGEKQFRTEVSIVGAINHVNLIRLRGFCSEGSRKLLVYDYMPNGSLDKHLFNAKGSGKLDWKTRYQIALGAARGLAYLHDKCRDSIIHCDIKPENILLDVDFCPKLADFGLAKLIGRDFSRVLTTIRGTLGYLAPEWISGVAITPKADVYSYGMMLFEIVSGKRNFQNSNDGSTFFPTWAAQQVTEGGNVLSLLDNRLNGNVDLEELYRICTVACWCIQDEEIHRPSMSQIVQILEGVVEVTLPPIPRFLLIDTTLSLCSESQSTL
ncbi:hypothetical protein CCACVL1_06162 [Corchorus capsularis]|uniref:Receptor-like serine/threonine-protein kinase n=1 Tax=Corchorus capsularis TaxID=210143 RepID=A0A1R3JH09_COCAP|nr:hypothetical protein CCACVL1_06162 [Corchorus capsularis]